MRRLAPFAPCLAAPAGAAPLTPAGLDALTLGAFVEGPVGVTVDSSFLAPSGVSTGDFSGGAACPAGFSVCAPPTDPAGTIYTFVQTVAPGRDTVPNDPPFAPAPVVVDPGPVESFAVGFRPPGFTGTAGYSFGDAADAGLEFGLRTAESALVFDVASGEWTAGEGVRFFFETTRPSAGPGGDHMLAGDPDGVAPRQIPAAIPAPAGLSLLAAGLTALGLARPRR